MKALLVDNVLLERTATGFQVDLQPHLGLISLIATLAAAGHDAELYDPKVQLAKRELYLGSEMYEEAAQQILARNPAIVGFTALGCSFISTLKIAAAVRRSRRDIPILLGGPHASLVDREILERHAEFDFIVRGEAEATISSIFDALRHGTDFAAIDGLTYRRNGQVCRTRDVAPILDLDALPIAAYGAFPVAELNLRSLDVDAGRGCPFHCAFCSTATFFGRRYRIKSARRLVEELDLLAARYGIRDFAMTHDLFTVNKQSVREFCAAVAGRGYTWNCSARMDCIDNALLGEMRDSGCNAIYYGVETGSQRMQRVVDKRLNLELYHPTVRSSLALGLKTTVSFITGFPAETAADRDATLELICDSMESYPTNLSIQLHLLTPEPGTALYTQHAQSLVFDGHIGDFNVPLLESDDAEIIRAEPDVFACHHHYAESGHRADDIIVTEAFKALYRFGLFFVAKLARRYEGSFAGMLRDFAQVRSRLTDDEIALIEFVRKRWGADDPFVDIVRYIVAAGQLRDDPVTLPAQPSAECLRLTRRAQPIDDIRDGLELFKRLRDTDSVSGAAYERSARLLLAAPGMPSAPAMFAIDTTTLAVAQALAVGTTRERLCADFGVDEGERRLWALELMGAVVRGGPSDYESDLQAEVRQDSPAYAVSTV